MNSYNLRAEPTPTFFFLSDDVIYARRLIRDACYGLSVAFLMLDFHHSALALVSWKWLPPAVMNGLSMRIDY